MLKVSHYLIQILKFKFYYEHTTKKKLPACTRAYIYQGLCRGWAWGGALVPPTYTHTFSDGKVIFFYFGYPELSLTKQTRFSNLTILDTHKQRTDKLCLIAVANEFVALNDNILERQLWHLQRIRLKNVWVTLNRCVCWFSFKVYSF